MTIADNVGFGLERKGIAKGEVRTRVAEVLELVDLAGRGGRKPSQLSGGQQQRVALARAIVNNPRVLLLDEPLGALDLKLRKQMQLELKRIQHEVGITFVHVTHDQEEAMTMADTIAVMNGGRIEQLGTPSELYERPANGVRRRVPRQVEPPAPRPSRATGVVRLEDGSRAPRPHERHARRGLRRRAAREDQPGRRRARTALSGKVKESAYIGVATEVVVATPVGRADRVPPERRGGRRRPAGREPRHAVVGARGDVRRRARRERASE